MIKSMTGFAAVTQEDEHASLSVTIRAVNHRHLDYSYACLSLWPPSSLRSGPWWPSASRAAGSS